MAEELVKVQVPFTTMVDDKVYFAGEIEVSPAVAKKLNLYAEAKNEAVAVTGNVEASPMTPEAEGPDVAIGAPMESSKKSSGKKGSAGAASASAEEDEA